MDMHPTPFPGAHMVRFYDDEPALAELVGTYLSGALNSGGAAVVIADTEHRDAFSAALAPAGAGAGRGRRVVMADAEEMLSAFMVDGWPDTERFDATVGRLVGETVAAGEPVHAYGEMVASLAETGNVAAALELEGLWNRLAQRYRFALLCAYPAACLADPDLAAAFDRVCHLHTGVVYGAPDSHDTDASRRFLATDHAPELARQFTDSTMRAWGYDETSDAVLAVSELATNAVRHAGGDLTVALARRGSGVRVAVGDTSRKPPMMAPPSTTRSGGRGMRIVEALTDAWGHHRLSGGKIVWADIPVLHEQAG